MGFSVGDKVKFLNDVGSGIITKMEGEKLAYVRVEEGFEIPYIVSELLLIEKGAEQMIEEKKAGYEDTRQDDNHGRKQEEDEDENENVVEDINISDDDIDYEDDDEQEIKIEIALVHAKQNDRYNSDIDIYMINDGSYHVLYNISVEKKSGQKFLQAGVLEPQIKVFVNSHKQKAIEKGKKLNFQLLFFRKGKYTYIPPLEETLELTKSNLVQKKFNQDNPYFDEPAQIIEMYKNVDFEAHMRGLSGDDIFKIIEKKDKMEVKQNLKSTKGNEVEEVDLHIQAIMDNYQDLSNGEIVNIQMDRFQTALEGAILHKTRKIVFIHGVGNGKLKYELRKKLDNKYPDLKYHDASFREYGYGATMVLIK